MAHRACTATVRGLTAAAVLVVAAGCGGDAGPGPADPDAIAVPAADGPAPSMVAVVVHEVESGDTLGSIAQRYGTTVAAIMQANGLDDPDRLAPGDRLRIPADPPPE